MASSTNSGINNVSLETITKRFNSTGKLSSYKGIPLNIANVEGFGSSFYFDPTSTQPVDGVYSLNALGATSGPGRWISSSPIVNVLEYGAGGKGLTDDTTAIRKAMEYAKSIKKAVLYFPNGTYRLSDSIVYDLTSLGQINRNEYSLEIEGNNSTIFLSGGTDSYWAMDFVYSAVAEQRAKLTITNLWFQTDNSNRPNGIRTRYAHFTEIHNVVFYQTHNGLRTENGGMFTISNTYPFGCSGTGVDTRIMRDTKMDNCLAYSCEKGFYFFGNNDGGGAGALNITNTNGVSCGTNFHLDRLQTGFFTSIQSDAPTNVGVLIESCSYLKVNGLQCGPNVSGYRAIHVKKATGGTNNDYCTYNDIHAENEIIFDYLNFSKLSKITSTHSSDAVSTAGIDISNSVELTFEGCKARDMQCQYAVRLRPTSSRIVFNGGEFDRPVWYESASRFGNHVMNNPVFAFLPVFDGGFPLNNESGSFIFDSRVRRITNVGIVPRYVVNNQPITSSSVVDFDLLPYVKQPPVEYISTSELNVLCGIYGSFNGATIKIIRTAEGAKATITSTMGVEGSAVLSIVNDTTLRVTNIQAQGGTGTIISIQLSNTNMY